ncbi:SAV_2336 N-terminal domain-related protein [Streptomyces sp. NPDC093544]|uniref:SAV_2336 N-terminal domain-related protein n=1 Tax=Streptomyces sp. NPDC093544 TaxID=3155200 RepID=UPI003413FF35
MAEAIESLVRALAGALSEDADATAIADALWLAAAPVATLAAQRGSLPEPAPSDDAGPEPSQAPALDAPVSPHPVEDAGATALYESLPHTPPASGAAVTVPGGRDLPRALELRRALRPFKRRYPQGRRSELNLDATVRDYRRTGELTPVFALAPEPWFELLLVIDASPSMAVWRNTNAEFATLLAGLGAFRRVRTWSLRPGSAPEVTDHQDRRVAPGQAVSSDGRRLVLVLSDCVAPGWRRPETWQLLRRWGAKGPVALLNPLPGRLWHRTGLGLPAIRVGQRRPALRNADLTFHVPLLLRTLRGAEDADWQALPTLTFSPHSLARWAETFMRGSPHGYDAVLVPRTGIVPSLFPTPNAAQRTGPDPTEAFLRTGSPSAVRLAALCSPFGSLSLPLMHLIRQQILPEAGVGDLAELLTSPVVTIQAHEDGPAVVLFDDATRERLASRLSRRDAWRTYEALSRHIAARGPGGAQDIQATATFEQGSVPPELYPFARASNELLALLRESGPVRPAPLPGISETPVPPPDPVPGQRLPDPAHSTALLIGVSRYARGHSLPGVDADLEEMRSYLTSPEGWNLPVDRCVSLVNPRGASEVLEAITRACDTADTVLLYFDGHGSVDLRGQAMWRLSGEGDDEWRTSGRLEFLRVAQVLDESRARHAMLILDHDGGAEATRALRRDLNGRAGRVAPRVQVLSVEKARGTSSRGPLTQELLRIASQGVPGGPEFLDLSAIGRPLSSVVFWSHVHDVVIARTPSAPAFARNRAWKPQVRPTGTHEEKGVGVTDPVDLTDAVYESVQRRLQSALPHTYQGVYRRAANRLLRALLDFAAGFVDGAEQADSEVALGAAAQDFLADRGITTEREVSRDDRRVDVVWSSEAGLFDVHLARDGAARSWNADSSVSFELVLDREVEAEMSDLVDCVSTVTSEAFTGGEKSCLVIMRLPVPQDNIQVPDVTVDVAEREAMDPSWGLRWFTRNALSDAVESACEQLLGEAVGDESADDDVMDVVWTLNGVALPSGLTDVTIQDVTPVTQSIVWDTVEEYEDGLVLGQVTVDVQLVLEGFMDKNDYALAMREVRLLEEVNDHLVEVSVERSAQLVFDARRESEDVELEFRGTNPPEPHPHEPT